MLQNKLHIFVARLTVLLYNSQTKSSKTKQVKLNALLATPLNYRRVLINYQKLKIMYNLINSLISLVCSFEGHQGGRLKNVLRAWIARCDFTLAFYIYLFLFYLPIKSSLSTEYCRLL